ENGVDFHWQDGRYCPKTSNRLGNSTSRISCGSFAPHAHLHFHSRSESVEDRHQTVHCESVEVGIANARKVSGSDPGPGIRLTYGQTLAIKGLDDFGREDGLDLICVRVLAAEITEYVAGPAQYLNRFFTFHLSISCS